MLFTMKRIQQYKDGESIPVIPVQHKLYLNIKLVIIPLEPPCMFSYLYPIL